MAEPNPTGCRQAARHFTKTTTLHGFKYLTSKYCYDRWGWVVCCCASACCAGVLCAVLWARFLQVPTLLTLQEIHAPQTYLQMPLVGVCPPIELVARLFREQLSINKSDEARLPSILDHVLRGRFASSEQLVTLEGILAKNNVTLAEALMQAMPPCHEIVKNCRWQTISVPCERLFEREITQWGVCCLSKISELKLKPPLYSRLTFTRTLSIAMSCSQHDKPMLHGCEFFTKYEGEDWMEPTSLTPGYNYIAQLSFTSVLDGDSDKLVDETCVSSKDYSRSQCLFTNPHLASASVTTTSPTPSSSDFEKKIRTTLKCNEEACGCSNPLRIKNNNEKTVLPLCPMAKLNCLRSFKQDESICKCLPSCRKVMTYLALESSAMNAFSDTFDDLYAGLNESTSTVLNIVIRIMGSKIFVVNPTETWITLLSSLGGVFNMFLGVGLFSALEILFLIFIKCPIAIRRSSEMTNTHLVVS